MGTSIKIVNLNGAREVLNICDVCHGIGWYAEQVSYTQQEQRRCENCNGEQDGLIDIHLEADVEAMARINLNVIKSESLKNRNPYILPEHEYSEFCSCWGCKLSAVIAESNANNLSKWARLVRK